MTMQTLESPDVEVGEEIQILAANARWIRVFGTSGGVGSVTSVTSAGAPITVAPATGAVVVGIDASYPAVADFWPFDRDIPAAVAPRLRQVPATVGAGVPFDFTTQAAQVGSAQPGGDFNLGIGKPDQVGAPPSQFNFYVEGVGPGGAPNTGFVVGQAYTLAKLEYNNGSGVTILTGGIGLGGGTGAAGFEISAECGMSLATELGAGSSSSINVQPAGPGGQSFFLFSTPDVGGLPAFSLGTGPADPVATFGLFRLAWDTSNSSMGLLVQRNATNTADFEILSRHLGETYFGNLTENPRVHALNRVLFELGQSNPFGSGLGYPFTSPSGVALFVGADTQGTVAFGTGLNNTTDGTIRQRIPNTDTSATTPQDIGTATLTDNAVTTITWNFIGRDGTTHEFVSMSIEQSYSKVAGTITAAVDGPTITNRGKSTTPVYATVAPTLSIVGGDIHLTVTPWTTDDVHWEVNTIMEQNTGTF